MSDPLPSAPTAPVPPPAAKLAIGYVRGQDVFFNSIGINLLTQIWAAMSGSGGAIDNIKEIQAQIAVIFGMHGDGTLSATGELTVVSSEGRVFVASAFIDTTNAGNITAGILPPARLGDGSIVYAKLQNESDGTLLGRSAGSAGAPMEISIGAGLALASGTLSSPASNAVLFAALPAVPSDGARGFITNCSTSVFHAAADGAGGLHVPVFYDGAGAIWRVG